MRAPSLRALSASARQLRAALLGSVLLVFGASPDALANDTSVGGTGVDLHSLKETAVRMQSEDIVIAFNNDSWDIGATYLFKNPTSEPLQLQLGFPEVHCSDDGDCRAKHFRHLRTEVNKKEVAHRKGSLKKTERWAKHLGTFWLFDATFPARAETEIVHRYTMEATQVSMPSYHGTYVTRTGATWAGPIGHARFTLRFPPHAMHVECSELLGTPPDPVFVRVGDQAYSQIVLEKSNWTPDGDLHFGFATALSWYRLDRYSRDERNARAEKLGMNPDEFCPADPLASPDPKTPAQVQSCINDLYGAWGYPFKRKELNEVYYEGGKSWGPGRLPSTTWTRSRDPTRLPGFKLSWVSMQERRLLQLLEGKLQSKTKGSSATANVPATSPPKQAPPRGDSAPVPSSSEHPVKPAAPKPATAQSGCSASPSNSSPLSWRWCSLLLLAARLSRRSQRGQHGNS